MAEQPSAPSPGFRRRRDCRRRPGRGGSTGARFRAGSVVQPPAGGRVAEPAAAPSNALPRPMPSLRAPIRGRRAARPGRAPATGRCRGRPGRGSRACGRLREHLEDRRQHLGRRCRCRRRAHDDDDLAVLRARAAMRDDGRPGAVYFAALVSRLENTCASRTGSASTQIGAAGMVDARSTAPPPRPAGRHVSSACRSTPRSVSVSLRSSSLPRVMRETSSRSSTSRTICATWRSIMSRGRRDVAGRPAAPDAALRRALRIGASGLRSSWASVGQELVLAPVAFAQRFLERLPAPDVAGN